MICRLVVAAALALAIVSGDCRAAQLVEIVPPELRGAQQPQIAASPSGKIHVTFAKSGVIYHVASSDDGRSFSSPVKVAELPKLALGMRRGPRITATDQRLVVSAISHEDGNLHALTSDDDGKTWLASPQINDTANSAREGLHAMAGDGKGFVIATWLDLRNGATELWSATSHDGGRTWGTNIRVYASPDGHICECCHPSVAISPRGEIAIQWRNWLGGARDLYLATSTDGGRSFSAAQKLGTGTWKLNACPMDGGSVIFDAAGKPVTAWRREKSVLASRSR